MSSAITPTTTASIQSIMRQFDTDGDGQFSLEEFSEFLNAFMKSVTGTKAATTSASSKATAVSTPALLSNGVSTSSSRLNDPLPPCPPGWSAEKWVDPSRTSIKYVAGRIMARYQPSDWVNETTREQILADFRTAGLNPSASGKDKCDFNDGTGPIDIVQSANEGGKAWQWIPVNAA